MHKVRKISRAFQGIYWDLTIVLGYRYCLQTTYLESDALALSLKTWAGGYVKVNYSQFSVDKDQLPGISIKSRQET